MKMIVQGLATEYRDEGVGGEAVIFLHGFGDTLHTFDLLLPILSRTFRVIRLDLPGFGGTEMPREPWALSDYVQFVTHFEDKLGVHPTAIIGHSLGGRIAIKGIATKRFHESKLILIASAGIAKRKTLRNLSLQLVAKIGKSFMSIPPLSLWKQMARETLYRNIGSDYLRADGMRETFLNIIREDLSEAAQSITIPSLLIWGKNDTETPLADGERLHQMIQKSKLVVIEHAGHFVHREEPREIATLIEQFLS